MVDDPFCSGTSLTFISYDFSIRNEKIAIIVGLYELTSFEGASIRFFRWFKQMQCPDLSFFQARITEEDRWLSAKFCKSPRT